MAVYLDPENGSTEVWPQKLRWTPFVGITAIFAANVADSVAGVCRAVALEFFSAANHDEAQEQFRLRAALEIEALTTGTPLLVPTWSEDDEDDEDEDDD